MTVTSELKRYAFNNVTLDDTWGWEELRKLYTGLVFQLMLARKLVPSFKMDQAASLNVLNIPASSGSTAPVDLVLFFITCEAVEREAYLEQMELHIKEAQSLNIPFLILLTQIDKVEPSLKTNPYCANPTIQELVSKVCSRIELDESHVVPVVNYTKETERTWAMDRAAFVTLYRAFQRHEESRCSST